MKKLIAIVTIGATTAFLKVNAQEVQPTEKDTTKATQTEVIDVDEHSQPEADYQHNQYGTYPQGSEDNLQSQVRTEIEKSELPQEVLDSFENSDYSDMEIVAIYEVKDTISSGVLDVSDEPSNEDKPKYDKTVNENPEEDAMINPEKKESEMANNSEVNPAQPNPEEEPVIESEQKEAIPQTETETTLAEPETQETDPTVAEAQPSDTKDEYANEVDPASNDTAYAPSNEDVKYEIQVKDKEENKQTTLTYTEEGTLEETSEESSM